MPKKTHNIKDVQAQLKGINREAIRQTCAHAINSAVRSVRTQGSIRISRSRIARITKKDAHKRIKTKFVSPKKSINAMRGLVKFSGLDLPLIFFDPKEVAVNTSKGKRFKLVTSISGQMINSKAFHLIYRKGGALKGGAGKGFGTDSLPFERNASNAPRIDTRPSLSYIVRKENIDTYLRKIAVERFVKRFKGSFNHYCKRSIEKSNKRYRLNESHTKVEWD